MADDDDVDGSSFLADSSVEGLRQLKEATDPHSDVVNAVLDEKIEQIGPRQDLALALDSLPQAAMEAGIELDERESA